MKITKETLKQIIKEEIENLKEYSPYGKGARPDKRQPKPGESPSYRRDAKPDDPKRSRPQRESAEGIDPDDMTHGEYFVHSGGPAGMEAELDEFSVAIRAARDAGVSRKDILAFVQQVLGDAQSDQVIDVM
jgi:hypothetical protein